MGFWTMTKALSVFLSVTTMRILAFILATVISGMATGQAQDPVLFSVGDSDVHVSEFKYIYEKNNSDNADYSRQSVEEYLELYKKFKLKVQKARSTGLDTITSLQKELEGYRKQLANSYLKDKEISNRLVDEVAVRMKMDKEVSHIFVSSDQKAPPAKRAEAEEKINNLYGKLRASKWSGFDEMAQSMSEDKISAKKNGALGYYTAPLPDGFYEFENAMYATEVGQVSKPFKSKMGYHIIKVTDSRPARGEMEIAHILIRKEVQGKMIDGADRLTDSLYAELNKGANFEKLAAAHSQDNKTKNKGGYLGYFGVNQYERAFEDAAFGLSTDGEISAPISTKIGYHIVKRISKRDNSDENRLRKRIEARIKKNNRFEVAEQKLIDDVKSEAGFKEQASALVSLDENLDASFYSYKWTPTEDSQPKTLFSLGGQDYTMTDFNAWMKTNVRERLKFQKTTPYDEAINTMYDMYVKESVISYEEANLENKYPDFKALMREYREGILLFEITKNEVWDKASEDTIGLRQFFDVNRSDYKWEDRADLTRVTIQTADAAIAGEAYKLGEKKGLDKMMDKYGNQPGMLINHEPILKDLMDEELMGMEQKAGKLSKLHSKGTQSHFYIFNSIEKSSFKTLKEARGYVIADYQDHLEKKWIDQLKSEFPIKVDDKILTSLIQ